jgi:periplasmic copper chaperone A
MMRMILAAAFAVAFAVQALAQQSPISVTNAWARATPPGAKTGAAYVTVTNSGTAPDRLLSVSTPAAGVAQLHTTINDNGVMKMRPVAGLDLKPGASLTLKPGGYHLMLMELKQPLKEGDHFSLVLDFAKAGRVETEVKVEKAGAMGDMGNMGDMKDMPGMNMK